MGSALFLTVGVWRLQLPQNWNPICPWPGPCKPCEDACQSWELAENGCKRCKQKCRCNGLIRGGFNGPSCDSRWQGKLHCYTNPNVCPDSVPSSTEKMPDENGNLTEVKAHWSFEACALVSLSLCTHYHLKYLCALTELKHSLLEYRAMVAI